MASAAPQNARGRGAKGISERGERWRQHRGHTPWTAASFALGLALLLTAIPSPPRVMADIAVRQRWSIGYCKYFSAVAKDGSDASYFVPKNYTYYGQFPLFSLPAPKDSVRPNAGEYAYSGSCEYVLDSACKIKVAGLACNGCCYISPAAVPVRTTCFDNVLLYCDYVLTKFTAQCGFPQPAYKNTTYCNICNLSGG